MSDGKLNAVVVGVGRMGQHHARNYAKIPDFKLVGVVDLNEANRAKAVGEYGCKGFASVEELIAWSKAGGQQIDAVSVAVPTVHHRSVAELLMANGADVLIEKPMAPDCFGCPGDRGCGEEIWARAAGGAHRAVQPGVSGAGEI